MKFFLSLLFAMNASGTAAFILYLLISALKGEQLCAHFKYLSIKLCLALFLIPFPLIKHLLFRTFSPRISTTTAGQSEVFLDLANSLHQTDDGFFLQPFSWDQRVILLLWGCLLSILLLFQLYRYIHFKRTITNYLIRDDAKTSLLAGINKKPSKKTVPVYYCAAPVSPFTYGFLQPGIVLTSLTNTDSSEMVLRHELQHIQCHDTFFRILALLTVILHCFNPFVYIMLQELKEVQEMNCDEKLAKEFSPKERSEYGNVIIDIAARAEKATAPALYFSKTNNSFLKKRIQRIASPPRKKRIPMVLLLGIICLGAFIPVYAYSPSTIDWRGNPSVENGEDFDGADWMIFSDSTELFVPEDEHYFQFSDEYLILENGDIVSLPDSYTPQAQAACAHTYATGQRKTHTKNVSSCTVYIYEVRYCTKCRRIQTETPVGHNFYNICPH